MKKILITLFILALFPIISCTDDIKVTKPKTTNITKQTKNNDISTSDNKISSRTVKLYFVDNSSNDYKFAIETKDITFENGEIAKAIINELIKGSTQYGNIIPQGTKLLSLKLTNDTLDINFSKEFLSNNHLGSGFECMMVYSIVNSVTELDTIKQVVFYLEGTKMTVGTHMDMSTPFKRNLNPIGQDDSTSLNSIGNNILLALKNKNSQELSNFVHQTKGVRLSPYSFIDLKKDIVLEKNTVKNFFKDDKKYIFGNYDGSGNEIKLTLAEYYNKFIFDLDFTKAPKTSIDNIIGKGNTTNNIKESYPKCNFIEYHYPSVDKANSGMDWRSLRLVLEKNESTYYLIGIVHDQWTI